MTARELTEPLARVLRWMLSHRDGSGAIICPEHRIEHTGKSAGAVVLAIELAKRSEGDERAGYVETVRQQCERIVSRLEREGDSTCFTFRPGRHDPYNCSNSVIDGGACSDALASAVLELGDGFTADERQRFEHAAVLHAQTYLRYAIVDKGIPAQCAWAMTGAAQAFRLSGHEVLRLACTVGAERIRGVMRGDGSIPYHAFGAEHPGAAEPSAYYHSRVPAFVAFALDAVLGAEAGAAEDAGFAPAMDFLHGLAGPDGVKTGGVEAKPWYFGSHREVASNPFDVAAFAAEWRRTRAPRAAAALRASYRAWLEHLSAEGVPRSHLGKDRRSYQCAMFWAAHASWIARSLDVLEEVGAGGDPAPPVSAAHFEDTDLVRLESADLVAWIRGRRLPGNASHGSAVGGGLLRVHSKAQGRDLFVQRRFERRPEGSWSGRVGWSDPGRGWRAGKDDLRFSWWLLRNRLRGREVREALREPLRALRRSVVDFASAGVSTAFDRDPELTLDGDGARMVSAFALRDGSGRVGRVEREFRLGEGGLEVSEGCVEAPRVKALWFRVPARAVVLSETARLVRYAFRP